MAPIVWNDFLPMTSEMDWCEPNYAVTSYIAEFYNTISNLPLVILPIILIILNKEYSRRVSCGPNVIWGLVITVGLGSTYFHGTLSRMGQLLDEVTISWVVHGTFALLIPRHMLPISLKGDRATVRNLMLLLAAIWSILAIIIPAVTPVILQFLGIPCFYVHFRTMRRCDCPEVVKLGNRAGVIFLLATACWLADQMFCPFWISINFPYLHSFFHILAAFAACSSITSFVYIEAIEKVPEQNPHLKYWPSNEWKVLSVPYIRFGEETKKSE
ncbi:alkaline ceramidase 2-like [Lineus longissimus]|uniref:alkaline ceramidase 2-like n=1 Tax=Lineus longissimus TaxID=88925 RepID=UPI002B4F0FAA